jgi:glycerol-3-phosphate acyltransferase PlsY
MPGIEAIIVSLVAAYLVGSIPTGLIVVRILSGRDVRTVGSGRTGGTNAFRAAGLPAGVLTGLADMAKGFVAVYIARELSQGQAAWLEAAAAVVAVAGHNWSVFLGFKGGAGTGPNAGAATAFWPWAAVILIPLVPVVLLATGYASVASTAASVIILVIFVALALLQVKPTIYIAYAIATTILVALALMPNYKRLVAGTERRVGPRAKAAATQKE